MDDEGAVRCRAGLCSPALGAIAKELQAATVRPGAIARTPALASMPAQQAVALRRGLPQIGHYARAGLMQSQAGLDGGVRELRGLIASALERTDQLQWLRGVGVLGSMSGAVLWYSRAAALPWGGGAPGGLPGLALAGCWVAGRAMLQDAKLPVVLSCPAQGVFGVAVRQRCSVMGLSCSIGKLLQLAY